MTPPVPRFTNDDDAAQHWLTLLRGGTDEQKVQAREQLTTIFERRGMYEEATDLLVSNVKAGVQNADIFRWLARLYRAQGDEVTAMQAAAEAAKYMTAPRGVVEPETVAIPVRQRTNQLTDLPPSAGGVVCPTCGFLNARVAETCRRCLFAFGSQPHQRPPRPEPAPRRGSTVKTVALGCVAVVLALCALGTLGSFASSFRAAGTDTASPTSTAVRAADANPPAPNQAVQTSAPTTKPQAKPASLPRVGERAESAGIAITVENVQKSDNLGQFMRAKPGRIYLVVTVALETTARDKAPYNPLYFKVRDGEGFEQNASLMGGDNSLKSGELVQGEKVRGAISFDVPSEAKGFVLSYQPAVIFGGYQTIRVQLE